MLSSHLTLWCSLLLLPSIFPSIRDFSSELAVCIRWPKHWSFSISLSSDYSGFISFNIDWFDLLAVQGTFRSLLQHHSLKASILWLSTFFMVQISQPYMTIGKTIALTTQTLVSRVICLCFSTHYLGLSSLSCQESIIFCFHCYSYCLQWFWSSRRGNLPLLPTFPFYFPFSIGARCYDLSFLNIWS